MTLGIRLAPIGDPANDDDRYLDADRHWLAMADDAKLAAFADAIKTMQVDRFDGWRIERCRALIASTSVVKFDGWRIVVSHKDFNTSARMLRQLERGLRKAIDPRIEVLLSTKKDDSKLRLLRGVEIKDG